MSSVHFAADGRAASFSDRSGARLSAWLAQCSPATSATALAACSLVASHGALRIPRSWRATLLADPTTPLLTSPAHDASLPLLEAAASRQLEATIAGWLAFAQRHSAPKNTKPSAVGVPALSSDRDCASPFDTEIADVDGHASLSIFSLLTEHPAWHIDRSRTSGERPEHVRTLHAILVSSFAATKPLHACMPAWSSWFHSLSHPHSESLSLQLVVALATALPKLWQWQMASPLDSHFSAGMQTRTVLQALQNRLSAASGADSPGARCLNSLLLVCAQRALREVATRESIITRALVPLLDRLSADSVLSVEPNSTALSHLLELSALESTSSSLWRSLRALLLRRARTRSAATIPPLPSAAASAASSPGVLRAVSAAGLRFRSASSASDVAVPVTPATTSVVQAPRPEVPGSGSKHAPIVEARAVLSSGARAFLLHACAADAELASASRSLTIL